MWAARKKKSKWQRAVSAASSISTLAQFPRLGELKSSIVLARNHQFSDRSAAVGDGDEIAFLPPVSGGSGRYTQQIFDAEQELFRSYTRADRHRRASRRQLLRGEDGAVVNFEGVVRNNTKGRPTQFLDYECYEAMAVKMMAEIGRDIAGHACDRPHRDGSPFGPHADRRDQRPVIVTAPHRKPAFEAALEGINRLKRIVPIWKKEHFADGEVWVEGEWDESVLKK